MITRTRSLKAMEGLPNQALCAIPRLFRIVFMRPMFGLKRRVAKKPMTVLLMT